MAFTNEQILSAYNTSREQGFSDAEIRGGGLANFQITDAQINAALGIGGSAAPAPAAPSTPAPAPAPAASFSPSAPSAPDYNYSVPAPAPAPTGLIASAMSVAAPAPAPATQFSNQQVYDAYQTSLGQGISDADIRSTGLARFGIKETQLDEALKQYQPPTIAPKPAGPAATAAPTAAPAGGDIYGTFGAGSYNPQNQAAVGSLIDPRTGGADFSNRNLFDANGNRIASNSGVAFGEIKNVVSNILSNTSLTAQQQADLVSGYIGSRSIGNADLANALGLPQAQVDSYLKSAFGDRVTSDFYRNQRANAALVPLPDNPVPAYEAPVEAEGSGVAGGKTFKVSDLFGIDIHPDGKRINSVSIFDPQTGQLLTRSGFYSDQLLRTLDQLGLGGNLGVFAGLNEAIAQIGIPFLPNEQYGPQGSDHGIDFDLLAKGFQGTAYDQTQDANALLKGPQALGQLQSTQELLQKYGITGSTSLIGKDIPDFITQSLSDEGVGGVGPYDPSVFGVAKGDLAPGGYQYGNVTGKPVYNPLQSFSASSPGGLLSTATTSAVPGIGQSLAPVFGGTQAPTIIGGGSAPQISGVGVGGGGSGVGGGGGGSTITTFNPGAASTGQGPATYQAAQAQIDPAQTVRGMIDSLLSQNSPFIQAARSRAALQANERGLLNSSIAAGAGEAAAIDAALGIATQDSNNSLQTLLANVGAQNTASQFNAGQTNAFDLALREMTQQDRQFLQNLSQSASQFDRNFALETQRLLQSQSQFDQNLGLERLRLAQSGQQFNSTQSLERQRLNQNNTQFGQNIAAQRDLALLNNSFQQAATQAQQQYDTLIKNDQAFNQQYAAYIDALFRIDSDTSLDAAAKETRKNEQTALLRNYAQIKGLKLDLSFLPTYAGSTAPATTSTQPNGMLATANQDQG